MSLCHRTVNHGHLLLEHFHPSGQIAEALLNLITLSCVRWIERLECTGKTPDLAFEATPTQDADLEGVTSVFTQRNG